MTVKPEFKIIADHLRSSSFLIADGVLPSNEGRGYVLRRIMRRAMRQLHKLGAKEVSMYKMVDALIKEMGGAYPELSRAREVIIETLRNEEEKFRETLEKGLKILEEEIIALRQAQDDKKLLSGSVAFKLYDTYGFPLDLTQDILKEKNLEVDLQEFDKEMEEQRDRARKNWAGSGEQVEEKIFFDLKEKFGGTEFLGYDTLESKAKILAIFENPKIIILDKTPFYGTSGGQVGDSGIIKNKNGEIKISETKKFAKDLLVHFIEEIQGEFKASDEIEAIVDEETRKHRAQNHSATHLLHKALKTVLGNSISQKGSNVDAKYFTFDFNLNRAMTAEEIEKVEKITNDFIKENNEVKTNSMALEKARESGAEALFGEKYDAEVRVVKMGVSVELCGGTHVKNTGDIEILKIISEKGIAAGIRRIEARSGNEAKKYLIEQEDKLNNLIKDLLEKNKKKGEEILELGGKNPEFTNTEDDPKKFAETLQRELKKKDKEIERLKKKNLFANLGDLKSEKIGEINFMHHVFAEADAKEIRDITNEIKARQEFANNYIFAFFGYRDGKVSVCIAVSGDLQDKFDATKLIAPAVEAVGGKGGGGKKDLAMGGGLDKDEIGKAVEVIKKNIA